MANAEFVDVFAREIVATEIRAFENDCFQAKIIKKMFPAVEKVPRGSCPKSVMASIARIKNLFSQEASSVREMQLHIHIRK